MVDADLELLGLPCPGEGRRILESFHGAWHQWEGQIATLGVGMNAGSDKCPHKL
jgi:GDPmannose 4,6-dehydratase